MLLWSHCINLRIAALTSTILPKHGVEKLAHFWGVFAENGDFVVKVSKSWNHGQLEICVLDHLQSIPEASQHVAPLLGRCIIDSHRVLVFPDVGQPLTQEEWTDPQVGCSAQSTTSMSLYAKSLCRNQSGTFCTCRSWKKYSALCNASMPVALSTQTSSLIMCSNGMAGTDIYLYFHDIMRCLLIALSG